MKKIKCLIEKYKEAKEWNRKQTGGTRRQSISYNEIDAILAYLGVSRYRYITKRVRSRGLFLERPGKLSGPVNRPDKL